MPTIRYLSRRLLRALLLLAGVSIITFSLSQFVPGDYFDELRLDPAVSSETLAALRKQHGSDETLVQRYGRWLASVFRGEWGHSVAYGTPAAPLLVTRARNTLILTATAVLGAWITAVPLALWTVCGGRWRQRFAHSLMTLLLAVPNLLLLLILLFLVARWGVLPAGGMTSVTFNEMTLWGKIRDLLSHMAVPALVLMLAALPTIFLHTRAAILETLSASFIRFARANGIPQRRLLLHHALPAAANPLITLMGLSAGTLLSAGLAVEAVVGWPGLGQLLLQATLQRDLAIITGAVMLSAMALLAANLLADILLYATNPKIREDA